MLKKLSNEFLDKLYFVHQYLPVSVLNVRTALSHPVDYWYNKPQGVSQIKFLNLFQLGYDQNEKNRSKHVRSGEVVMVMGAGNIYNLTLRLRPKNET